MIDFTLIQQSLPALLSGLKVSLQIAALSCCIGSTLGTLIALVQTRNIFLCNLIITLYLTVIRGTPMLIQIVCAYYLLPHMGITIDAFWTTVIAIGLNSSAYISQTIRSGIQAIPRGQLEAAQVLGLTKLDTIRFIVMPQALAIVMPALGNELTTLVKDSSLASTVGVAELAREGRLIITREYDAISIFFIIAVLYLLVTSTISFLVHILEKRMRIHAQH